MKHLKPNDRIKQLIRPVILGPLLIAIGFVGLYFSTIIRNPYTILYPSALIVGTIVFYGVSENQINITKITANKMYSKVIVLFFFFILSVLAAQYHSVGFARTSGIFYLTYSLYLLAGLYILICPRSASALSLILIAGLTNRLTAYYHSVLYSGVDIYIHSRWVEAIVADGSLETLAASKYFYAPFYHILAAGGELVYSVPTRSAIALTTLLAVAIIPVLVVYNIVTQFWNVQTGLTAGLLYTTADHAINWAIHAIPTSLGVAFFALLFFSLIRYILWRKSTQYAFVVVFIVALTFTHQVSLFIGILTTGILSVVVILYQFKFSKKATNLGLIAGLLMFVDFVITRYSGPEGDASFFDSVMSTFAIALLERASTAARPEVAFPQNPSISPVGAAGLTVVQVAGSTILLTLAVVGTLYWLSFRDLGSKFFIGIELGTTVTILLTVALAGPVVGLANLLPSRWWAFIYVLLTILAAPGLIICLNTGVRLLKTRSQYPSLAFASVILIAILLPYVVLMGGNWAGAGDRPLLDNAPGAESAQISEPERQLFEHTVKYENEMNLATDRRASTILSRYYDTPTQTLLIAYNEPESLQHPSLIINREYIQTKHSQYYIRLDGEQYTVHGVFPIQEISNKWKHTIYDNGDNDLTYYNKNLEDDDYKYS